MDNIEKRSGKENSMLVDTSAKENCRICFEIGMNPLISPCNCLGSTQFVHELCLKKWIRTKYRNLNGAECEICKYKFQMTIKRDKKCDPLKAMPRRFSYCYFIPICVFFVIAMAIVTGVVARDKLDFSEHLGKSIAVLGCCVGAMVVGLLVLAKSLYHVLVIMQVKEWKIEPFPKVINSSNDR
jgi:hypothetical protein